MLALCLTLSVAYYAQNYAGIIGWSLVVRFKILSMHMIIVDLQLHLKRVATYLWHAVCNKNTQLFLGVLLAYKDSF